MAKTPAWQRKAGKSKSGGLNKKGVASYRKANPGSKLQTAVTTKPSKLKKGSKASNRRKSFCARMKGMKKKLTSSKTARDPNSRINKSLRKWNCQVVAKRKDPIVGTGKKPKGSGRRLYTDENPDDTVRIKFTTAKDARATVAKVKRISKPFARKIQILTVMEQRAKVMGKSDVAAIAKKGKESIRNAHKKKK